MVWASLMVTSACLSYFVQLSASHITYSHIVVCLFVSQVWLQHLCMHYFFLLYHYTPRADYFIKVSLKHVIPFKRHSWITYTNITSFTHCPRHLSLFTMILFIYLSTCLSAFFFRKQKPCLFCHCCVQVPKTAKIGRAHV